MDLHQAFAEIDLNALALNLKVVKQKAKNSDILAVVKANAYGHGAVHISRQLIQHGISKLGVAFTSEAIALRESGIDSPIVVFFDRDNVHECFQYNLTPVVYDFNTAKRISAEACKRNRTIAIHIKVDTGMGRVGLNIHRALKEISNIASLQNITLEGLMSHFSEADLGDKDFANLQMSNFNSLARALKQKNIYFTYCHIANSAAVLSMPDAHLSMVRPGIMLYGYAYPGVTGLQHVLSLKSKVLHLKKVPPGTPISYGRTFITKRKSTIATIPIGYADGYSRKLSNNGEVLINGRRAPVAGRVCMDTTMVDVTDIPNVSYKSDVVLIGKQGNERITAEDIANRTGTIPYEVLTSIGQRVKRIYTERDGIR